MLVTLLNTYKIKGKCIFPVSKYSVYLKRYDLVQSFSGTFQKLANAFVQREYNQTQN